MVLKLAKIGDTLKKGFEKAGDAIKKEAPKVLDDIKKGAPAVGGILKGAVPAVGAVGGILKGGGGMFKGLFGGISNIVKNSPLGKLWEYSKTAFYVIVGLIVFGIVVFVLTKLYQMYKVGRMVTGFGQRYGRIPSYM